MRCVIDNDVAAFAAEVMPWLLRDPVANNLACTLIQQRLDGTAPVAPDTLWLRVVDDGLTGVAVRTPPWGLLMSDMPPDAVNTLAQHLADLDVPLGSADGPDAAVTRFATRYAALTGVTADPTLLMRLYRLDQVRHPAGVPGQLRAATPADRDLLVAWSEAMHAEADEVIPDPAEPVDRRMSEDGLLWLWQDHGRPVSMAWLNPAAAGVVRINGVYTPPESRRRGYATGCCAAVSQVALDRGAVACMLYANRANPYSNAIYRRIGYRQVGDAALWRFR